MEPEDEALLVVLDALPPAERLARDAAGIGRPPRSQAVAAQALRFADSSRIVHPALVNGAAGVVIAVDGRPVAIMGFTVVNDRIIAIDTLADPERIAHSTSGSSTTGPAERKAVCSDSARARRVRAQQRLGNQAARRHERYGSERSLNAAAERSSSRRGGVPCKREHRAEPRRQRGPSSPLALRRTWPRARSRQAARCSGRRQEVLLWMRGPQGRDLHWVCRVGTSWS